VSSSVILAYEAMGAIVGLWLRH